MKTRRTNGSSMADCALGHLQQQAKRHDFQANSCCSGFWQELAIMCIFARHMQTYQILYLYTQVSRIKQIQTSFSTGERWRTQQTTHQKEDLCQSLEHLVNSLRSAAGGLPKQKRTTKFSVKESQSIMPQRIQSSIDYKAFNILAVQRSQEEAPLEREIPIWRWHQVAQLTYTKRLFYQWRRENLEGPMVLIKINAQPCQAHPSVMPLPQAWPVFIWCSTYSCCHVPRHTNAAGSSKAPKPVCEVWVIQIIGQIISWVWDSNDGLGKWVWGESYWTDFLHCSEKTDLKS